MTKTLEIVAVTFEQAKAQLPMFVYSLLAQTSQDYVARIYFDGPSDQDTRNFMEMITKSYPDNFEFIETDRRLDVHGHQNRATGLNKATSPWLHFTNCDNYVIPVMVQATLSQAASNQSAQVVTFDILHSYFQYKYFDCRQFKLLHSDMASFIIRREIAQAVDFKPGMGDHSGRAYWDKKLDFSSDGFWIDAISKKFPSLRKSHLQHALVVHN